MKGNGPEPLIITEFPERPWQKLGSDLLHFNASNYLLVIDYFSRYIEIAKLNALTSASTIVHLKSIFARHGVPETFFSDNGPQYDSKEFVEFADKFGFQHITSSPRFPQSNGEAERGVKTFKEMLKKAQSLSSHACISFNPPRKWLLPI